MALTIEELNIQIEAESTKATSAIDALIGRLETLQSKMSVFNSIGKSFSKTFGEIDNAAKKASNSTKQVKNSFSQLEDTIKAQENELKLLKNEYASYVLNSQKGSSSARDFATEIKNLSNRLENNKAALNTAQQETDKLTKNQNKFIVGIANGEKPMQKFTDNLARQISKFRTLYGAFKSVANTMGSWFHKIHPDYYPGYW